LDDLDARVDELESIVDLNQRTVNSVHKVMWLGATAMAAGLLTYIKKGL